MFHPVHEERSALCIGKRSLHFCLLKDSYQVNRVYISESLSEYVNIDTTKVKTVHTQEFCALYDIIAGTMEDDSDEAINVSTDYDLSTG